MVKKGTSGCLKNVRQLQLCSQYQLSVDFYYILTFSFIIYNANIFILHTKAVIQMEAANKTGMTEELSAFSHLPKRSLEECGMVSEHT